MVFTSFEFIIFFLSLSIFYFSISIKYRWKLLLISSLFFYGLIKPIFILILLFISITIYLGSILFEKIHFEKYKFYSFIIILLITIAPLLFFKYFNSINQYILIFFERAPSKNILSNSWLILPIGISYYTFMAVGYITDVYNEKIKAEKNLFMVMLFISFFPLVMSGPIERAEKMFDQFRNKLFFDYKKVIYGFQMILWGMFLKLVLADNLSLFLNPIFENINYSSGKTILLAISLYPFQIYGDLGGYSLLAIGFSSILGVHVRINFKRPFFSTSMSNFWRRWHISLISWITDYIYTPITFFLRKNGLFGIILSLLLTFLIAGLWHDATLPFVIWGLIQGVVLSLEAITKSSRLKIFNKNSLNNNIFFKVCCSILVYFIFSFSLIFGGPFESLNECLFVIEKIFLNNESFSFSKIELLKLIILISLVLFLEFKQEYYPEKLKLFRNKNLLIRWISYLSIILFIVLLGVFSNDNFIYFQF